MPNGGYPLHLLMTPPGRPDLCCHVRGQHLRLAQWGTRRGGGRILIDPPLAVFTDEQSTALLFHLAYWAAGDPVLTALRQRGIGPALHRPGVEYDY